MSKVITLDGLRDYLTNLKRLFVTKTDAESTYETKANAANIYETKEDAATHLTKTEASETYITKADAADTYENKTDASKTYVTKTDAAKTYATKSEIIVHVGVIIPFAGTSVPTGYLLCNGAAVSRTNYANLFAAIGTLYGAGDGSTTFNLPDARDRVLQGASGKHSVGSYIAAGLPNITGSMQPMYWFNASSTGAMNGQSNTPNAAGSGGISMGQADVTFNASRSSSYYGASTKPQVDAIATNFIIKY